MNVVRLETTEAAITVIRHSRLEDARRALSYNHPVWRIKERKFVQISINYAFFSACRGKKLLLYNTRIFALRIIGVAYTNLLLYL